jgi:hypothetical protein
MKGYHVHAYVLIEVSPVGCTSIRIIVTLRYEYRLFVAVIM